MAEDYWCCSSCGQPNRFGSNGGCPNCGSQDDIIPHSIYMGKLQGKMYRWTARQGWYEIDYFD